MNERVKELFIQLFGKNNFPKGNAEVYMSADDLKEFAESIVLECIDIVAAGGEFASRPKLVEKLQEHFGVEE